MRKIFLARTVVVALLVMAWAAVARAQSVPAAVAPGRDHAIVYELGWAGDWSPSEGLHPKGGTFAIEVTPVEGGPEVEFGVAAIRAGGSTEIPVNVLFMKSWTLTRQFELMAGVGPELIHATGPDHDTFWGLSSVLHLMVWPRKNVGWWVESGYDVAFRNGAKHQGLGLSAGLLIGR